MANPKKPITIDELAQMVERGFAETASKKDIWLFREEVEQQIKVVTEDVALLAETQRPDSPELPQLSRRFRAKSKNFAPWMLK